MSDSICHVGTLKQVANQISALLAPVDSSGELLCDFDAVGGTREELMQRLGLPSLNFSKVKFYDSTLVPHIRIRPLYPGKQLPEDMEFNKIALLTFDPNDQTECPKYLIAFQFSSFVGEPERLKGKMEEYEQGEVIGRGGFGVVTKVKHIKSGKYYAMKKVNVQRLINKNSNSITPDEAKRRITMETTLQRQVRSPNVIKIKEQIDTDNDIYIVMELATQDTLETFIDSKAAPLQPDEFVNIALQICQAVKATHDRKIIHRDLKPENLVFCEDKMLKHIDFGLARQGSEASTLCGTPFFVAPEIVGGKNNYTNAADIFSLGCIFYFMMTKQNAFQMTNGLDGVFQSILKDEPKPITNNIYSSQMLDLLKQTMKKDPTQRPSINFIIDQLKTEETALKSLQSMSIPIHHWKLDESQGAEIHDCGSSPSPGRIVNECDWITDGPHRHGLRFSMGQCAHVETGACMDGMKLPLSISLWVNPDDEQLEYADIIGNHFGMDGFVIQRVSSFASHWIFQYGDGRHWVGGSYPRPFYTKESDGFKLVPGQWQQLFIVFLPDQVQVFINGQPVCQFETQNAPLVPGKFGLMIGSGYPASNCIDRGDVRHFSGAIEDVKVFDVAVSEAEINEMLIKELGEERYRKAVQGVKSRPKVEAERLEQEDNCEICEENYGE